MVFGSVMDLEGKVVVGVDEFNNGLPHRDLPFIVVAYTLFPDDMVRRSRKEHAGKSAFPGGESEHAAWRERALEYLGAYRNFWYGAITKSEDLVVYSTTRAVATARVIHESLQGVAERRDKVVVVIDGRPFNRFAEEMIVSALSEYGTKANIVFRVKADTRVPAVMVADRVAYYLAGLRYGGSKRRKWPYRMHKVDFRSLPKELGMDDEDSYTK